MPAQQMPPHRGIGQLERITRRHAVALVDGALAATLAQLQRAGRALH